MDTYDEQITALLDDDYDRFIELIGKNNDDRTMTFPTSHKEAWCYSATFDKSIFSFLPDLYYCASQIEYVADNVFTYVDHIRDMVMKDSKCSLPYMTGLKNGLEFKYTKEELEEFTRRQRIARNLV